MEFEEMVSVLNRVNEKAESPVDKEIIKQILTLVIKNPLDSDRGRCQEQIMELIKQNRGD